MLYKQQFEDNRGLSQKDLWNYISKKIANEGENIFKVPSSYNNPLASKYARKTMNIIEADEIENLSKDLHDIIDDPNTTSDDKDTA